jgi:REP element-mobilizing transposase RayT
VPIGPDTFATRRHLPHFAKRDRTLFVTFTTLGRRILTYRARTIALDCCVHDHELTYWLHTAVVMPDHVHMLFTPFDEWGLAKIMRRVKGNSARLINRTGGTRGAVWQDESFDRTLRSNEDVRKTGEYIAANPVRAGLVAKPEDYPWLWQEWRTGNPACPDFNGER